MKSMNPAAPSTASPWLVRTAAWCAYVSGAVSVFGIAFLVAFFTLGGLFGPLNDLAVIVQYVLMLPIALATWQLLRQQAPGPSLGGLLAGIIGMLAVIVLQGLLVAGLLPFREQIVLVVPAFLVVLAWFVINAYLDRSAQWVPSSMLFNVLAGLYFAYPFWAFSVGRRLRSLSWESGEPRR